MTSASRPAVTVDGNGRFGCSGTARPGAAGTEPLLRSAGTGPSRSSGLGKVGMLCGPGLRDGGWNAPSAIAPPGAMGKMSGSWAGS